MRDTKIAALIIAGMITLGGFLSIITIILGR